MKKAAWLLVAGFAAGAFGAAAYLLSHRSAPSAPPVSTAAGADAGATASNGGGLPEGLAFTDLDGHLHRLAEWRGKLLLINFWATWCTPCMGEIPELVKLQRRYAAQGLQIVGPAADAPESAQVAIRTLGINYPVMGGELDATIAIMEKLGNDKGGLPFSVLISPEGAVLDRHYGAYNAAELDRLVRRQLPRPEHPPS